FVRTAQEAASRRGTERFRALVQAAPMAVIGMDLAGNVNAWNPAAERIFGWPAEEVVGKKITTFPAEKENEVSEIRRRISGGEIVAGLETVRLTRAGREIPVSISGAPIYDENGALISLMVLDGCSDLLDRALPPESPARLYLNQIQRTTEKAAAITKQLLAFSRKQILEMK